MCFLGSWGAIWFLLRMLPEPISGEEVDAGRRWVPHSFSSKDDGSGRPETGLVMLKDVYVGVDIDSGVVGGPGWWVDVGPVS